MAKKVSGLDEILGRWRTEIKGKRRRIISFEETVDIKINSLNKLIFTDVEPLNGWEFKHFKYTRQRERIAIDDEWRPISVGERWGGPDMSAKFRCNGRMPARFKGKTVVLKVYFS
ncbi:MAG: hypothetical protein WCI03_00635 [bacterium]|jgi:hypothetical protein